MPTTKNIFTSLIFTITIMLIFLSFIRSGYAATYYLSPTGSDSGTGSISSPWFSLDYALNKYRNGGTVARVAPGDTLYLRGGIYNIASMSTNTDGPYIFLGGSNSYTSPITTIKTYPTDFIAGNPAILDGTGTRTCLRSADTGKNYNVVIADLEVRNAGRYGFDMREDVGMGGTTMAGCTFRNIYFHDNTNADVNTNPTGLMLAGENCIIEYCTFKDNGTVGSSHLNSSNLALLNSYNTDLSSVDPNPRKNNIVRYNRFIGSAIGIKDKGDSNFINNATRSDAHPEWANQIYNNIFKDQLGVGYYIQQDYVSVHHNVFDHGNMGIWYDSYNSNAKTVWEPKIFNNTFLNCTDSAIGINSTLYRYGYNWTITNNLFLGASAHPLVFFGGQTNIWPMTSDYNGFDTSQTVVARYLNYGNVNFSAWKSYGYDTNSINTALSVTNSVANNYTLPQGSRAIGAGTSGVDLGAFAYGGIDWYSQTGYKLGSSSASSQVPSNLTIIAKYSL